MPFSKPFILLPLFLVLILFSCNNKTKSNSVSIKYPHREYEDYSQDEWYKIYSQNKLDSAKVLLEKHLLIHPQELPSLTFYAELLRRVKEYSKADSVADVVLSLDSCESNAYQVKGDLRNPQYGKNHLVESDSINSDNYYLKGIEIDSTNGNLWEVELFNALERNDIKQYKRGLLRLYSHGHYTKTALSYAKLLLRDLPKNAIIFSNGDMDTYPLLALQEGEKYREDVIVVNLSLLNLTWYFQKICDFGNINYKASSINIDSINYYRDGDKIIYKSTQFFIILSQLQDKDIHNRPLCFLNGVPTVQILPYKKLRNKLVFKGYYALYDNNTTIPYMDYDSLTSFMDQINPEDFKMPLISKYENSPLLLNNNNQRGIHLNIIHPSLQYVSYHISKSNIEKAKLELAKVKNYINVIEYHSEKVKRYIEHLETQISNAKN